MIRFYFSCSKHSRWVRMRLHHKPTTKDGYFRDGNGYKIPRYRYYRCPKCPHGFKYDVLNNGVTELTWSRRASDE